MIQFVVAMHVQGFILEAGCPPLRVATIHTRNACTCIGYITRWRSLRDLHTEGRRPLINTP